jgi:hypothetical protein
MSGKVFTFVGLGCWEYLYTDRGHLVRLSATARTILAVARLIKGLSVLRTLADRDVRAPFST